MAKGTIIVAEDEAGTRTLIAALLKAAGWTVFAVPNAEECLRQLDVVKPRAVLLDVNLPGLNGVETARLIRRSPVTQALPIVFVTAHTTPMLVGAAREVGRAGIVVKPFDPKTFAEKVDRAVASAQRS